MFSPRNHADQDEENATARTRARRQCGCSVCIRKGYIDISHGAYYGAHAIYRNRDVLAEAARLAVPDVQVQAQAEAMAAAAATDAAAMFAIAEAQVAAAAQAAATSIPPQIDLTGPGGVSEGTMGAYCY